MPTGNRISEYQGEIDRDEEERHRLAVEQERQEAFDHFLFLLHRKREKRNRNRELVNTIIDICTPFNQKAGEF
jgi:pyruvate-formate lyase